MSGMRGGRDSLCQRRRRFGLRNAVGSPMVLLICLSATVLQLPTLSSASKAEQKKLILDNLFNNGYQNTVPPHDDDDGAVKVETRVSPVHISIDENEGIMATHVWFGMRWYDNRLKWDASQYEGVDTIHCSPWRIWRPDFRAFNGVDQNYYMRTQAILQSSGLIFWVPPVTFKTSCDLDYTYWPWDVQVCRIVIGSWTKSGDDIDLLINLNSPETNGTSVYTVYYNEKLWEIVWSQAVISRIYYYSNTFYPDYTVTMKLRRASWVDRKVAVLPIILTACLTLATFWTHALSKSRMQLGTTNLIVIVLLLLFLRTRLPMAGGQLPLIVTFAGSMGVLVTVQLLASLAVANLVARKDEPPYKLVEPLHGVLGKVLCLSNLPLLGQIPNPNSFVVDMDAMKIGPSTPSSTAAPGAGEGGASDSSGNNGGGDASGFKAEQITGWNLLSQALDRVLFVIYLLIIIIFVGCFFGGAAVNDQA